MTATKSKSKGSTAWQWIVEHSDRRGSLVTPKGLTVAALEAACGKGALAAARKYCERVGRKSEFGPSFPYAYAILPIREAYAEAIASGEKTAEWVEDYAVNYWEPKYGPDCHHARKPGFELPTDLIAVKYPVVA